MSRTSIPETAAGGVPGPRRRTSGAARLGVALAALLGIADVIGGAMQLSQETLPLAVSSFMIAAGAATLLAAPFAWRGAVWATWAIILLRLLSALTGLPAFFVPGIPAGVVIAAAVGIVLACSVAVLLLLKPGRATP